MKKSFLSGLFLIGPMLTLLCGPSQNPYSNPADAIIVPAKSLQSLDAKGDSVKAFTSVQCSVEVYLPKLIDSFYVHVTKNGGDTIIAKGAISGTEFSFTFSAGSAGTYGLDVIVVKTDGTHDSLSKTVTVFVYAPVVTPDSLVRHVILPADSFTFNFTVADADSNVWKAYTWLDTAENVMQETSFAPKTHHAVFSRTLNASALLAALKAPVVCNALAIDADSNVSKAVACTLIVTDTTAPTIRLLSPDTANPVTSLPDTIRALVSDLAGISSATFNGSSMTLAPTKDTVSCIASSLDTGRHTDSIIAVDGSGNKGRLYFPLTYHGKQLYRPEIKELSRATTEGHLFDSLWLDTCVTTKDPAVTDQRQWAHDSLTWFITDSAGNQLAVSASHRIAIPQSADTEWAGSITLTFKVWITNNPALSDTKQPIFFVAEVWDPPVITLANQTVCGSKAQFDTIYLDTIATVRALDNAPSTLQWSFTNGKHFRVNQIDRTICIAGKFCRLVPTRYIAIDTLTLADSTWTGTDTLTFTVTAPDHPALPTSKEILFTRLKFCFLQPVLPKQSASR